MSHVHETPTGLGHRCGACGNSPTERERYIATAARLREELAACEAERDWLREIADHYADILTHVLAVQVTH